MGDSFSAIDGLRLRRCLKDLPFNHLGPESWKPAKKILDLCCGRSVSSSVKSNPFTSASQARGARLIVTGSRVVEVVVVR